MRTELYTMTTKLDDKLASLTINNVDDVLKDCLYEISTSTAYKNASTTRRQWLLSYFASSFMDDIVESAFTSTYYSIPNVSAQFTPAQRTAITKYCGSAYRPINTFLLGQDDPESTTLKHIESLDSAFERGITLPKGVTLYRGQRLSKNEVVNAAETKLFYFRNYVSTSMKPIIFQNAFAASVVSSYDAEAPSTDTSTLSTVIDSGDNPHNNYSDDSPSKNIGFIIKGAEVTKVILPSGMTNMPSECEILLPRGTVFKVNRITGAGDIDADYKTYLAECTVIAADQIDETAELYDGDLFMAEGIVEPIKKSGYFTEMYASRKEDRNNEGWQLLSSVVDLSNVPEKFIL